MTDKNNEPWIHEKEQGPTSPELRALENKRADFMSRMAYVLFEIVGLFALPAVAAVVYIKLQDISFVDDKLKVLGILGVSFVFSWVVVIIRLSKIQAKLNHFNAQVRAERERVIGQQDS